MNKGKYEIRIFNQRSNLEPDYIEGDKDIKLSSFCDTVKELMTIFFELYKDNEGESHGI